ncbi:MAG: AAA family ATPase [Planctomycetota bacterium]
MIEELRVQNYKALRDVTLKLTPVHVLIGPNDSGKTSILEALAALCRSVDHSLPDAFLGDWQNRALVWRRLSEPVLLEVMVATGIRYALSCQFGPSGRSARIHGEWAAVEGHRLDFAVDSSSQTAMNRIRASGAKPNFHTSTLGGDCAGATWERILDSIAGVQIYRWNPRLLALPAAADAKRRFDMDPTGFGLPLFLDNILGFDRSRFAELERELQHVFPEIESIKLMPEVGYRNPIDDPKQVPTLKPADGKGIHFGFADNGHVISAAQVSDGVLLVLAYLTILHSPEPPRVLLIEEPENGVHPKRLKEVLEILRQLVQEGARTQVVLTTHSPYALDLFKPEEVTLCHKEPDGSVSVHRLSDSPMVREQLKTFTLGEIWTTEGDEKLAASAARAEGTLQ